jgi:[ribosomal protein S5]-alanine N-acetyltransferase
MMLTSERLVFRDFVEEDFPLYCSVFTNEQVMQYAYNDRFTSEEECRASFDGILQSSKTTQGRLEYEFAAFTLADECFAGFAEIGIDKINQTGGCGEIGYFLLPECWGKGYATETATALIDFCFTSLNLHRVQAHCNSNNVRSENVMQKAGMTMEGEHRRARFKHGRWDNEKCYSILKEEWLQSKHPQST